MTGMSFLKNLWRDDRGQSTTEYILILAVVVMVAVRFKAEFKDRLIGIVQKLGGDIEQAASMD